MIDKPIVGVHTETREHPAGKEGAMLSLDECAARAWKARMSPRLRAWTINALEKAGASKGTRREKGAAILAAFRKKVPYVADPVMGELMATPEQTLCLDEGGLCMLGGDCDDMAIALAAAMMSIGVPAMIIGSSHHQPADVPTHVYMAFQDELDRWVRMDGTTKHPMGHSASHLREFWIEPGKDQKDKGVGDFVGMSGADGHGKSVNQKAGTLAGVPRWLNLRYPGIR